MVHINTNIILYVAVLHYFYTQDSCDLTFGIFIVLLLCRYFETYGCIPELNDDHSEEKFTAMRKVSDISTVHKGDNTCACVYWSLYYCNCVLQS